MSLAAIENAPTHETTPDGEKSPDDKPSPVHETMLPDAGSLEAVVLARLRQYVADLHGVRAENMYALIMPQLERPLVQIAMEMAHGHQGEAARMLGIHRNTLRARLRALGLSGPPSRWSSCPCAEGRSSTSADDPGEATSSLGATEIPPTRPWSEPDTAPSGPRISGISGISGASGISRPSGISRTPEISGVSGLSAREIESQHP